MYSDGTNTAAASKTIVINNWQPRNVAKKSSISDVAAVLDPPLHLQSLRKELFKLVRSNFSVFYDTVFPGIFQEFKKDPFHGRIVKWLLQKFLYFDVFYMAPLMFCEKDASKIIQKSNSKLSIIKCNFN